MMPGATRDLAARRSLLPGVFETEGRECAGRMVQGVRAFKAIAGELYLRPDVVAVKQLATSAAGVPRIATTELATTAAAS